MLVAGLPQHIKDVLPPKIAVQNCHCIDILSCNVWQSDLKPCWNGDLLVLVPALSAAGEDKDADLTSEVDFACLASLLWCDLTVPQLQILCVLQASCGTTCLLFKCIHFLMDCTQRLKRQPMLAATCSCAGLLSLLKIYFYTDCFAFDTQCCQVKNSTAALNQSTAQSRWHMRSRTAASSIFYGCIAMCHTHFKVCNTNYECIIELRCVL